MRNHPFENRISKYLRDQIFGRFDTSGKILVATSGGVDSTVLAICLYNLGYEIELAHVNYGLRDEADGDETFVRELGFVLGVEVHTKKVDARKLKENSGRSLQAEARNIRYAFFEEIARERNFSLVATGHNLDDQIETCLWHFMSGSSISALAGIPRRNGIYIRPLLSISREEIERYAVDSGISWREDKSNQELDYQRNIIRLKLIPIIKELIPGYRQSILKTVAHIVEADKVLQKSVKEELARAVKTRKNREIVIDLDVIKDFDAPVTALHLVLNNLGFHEDKLQQLLHANPGAIFTTNTGYEAWISGDGKLLIYPRVEEMTEEIKINRDQIPGVIRAHTSSLAFSLSKNLQVDPDSAVAQVDQERLTFPLTLRTTRDGDKFCPIGMEGHSQKLQDFFVNHKYSPNDKRSQLILLNGNGEVSLS
jgi:tRNA(Ile)-lysidine synthase